MRKAVFWAVFLLLLFAQPSFASSREEGINRTLKIIETIQSLEKSSQKKSIKKVAVSRKQSPVKIKSASPAQPSKAQPSKLRVFAGGATQGRGIFYIDYLSPLFYSDDQDTLLFFNPKQSFSSPYSDELNLGLGLRHIFLDKFILGVHSFFDSKYSTNNIRHKQLGYGLEFLSEPFDFRFNYYDPNTKPKTIGTSHELGSTHLLDVFEKEEALRGFDFEFGAPLFERIIKTRGYLGGFFYNSKLAKDVKGFKARTETLFYNWLSLDTILKSLAGGEIEFIGGLRFTIPLEWGRPRAKQSPVKNTSQGSYIKDRLFERVVRDIDIQSKGVTQKQTDPDVEIIYVNNTNTSATEDGSLEHPYNTLAEALSSSRYGTGKYVYVFKGDGSVYTGGITLSNNVKLWGSGYDGGFNGIAVPGYPIISQSGANAITLAQSNTIMGFQIQNSGNGIYFSGAYFSSVNINHNIIKDNSSGIRLAVTSGSSSATISDNAISNNNTGDALGIVLDCSTSGSISATISGNTISNNGVGILAGNGSDSLSTTISGNTISNNVTGIGLESYSSGIQSSNIYRNTISNNTNRGIAVFKLGSVAVVADIGGGTLGSIGYNSIYSNTNYNVYSDTTDVIKAENNWWGQALPDAAKISSSVDYNPYLSSNPN